MGRDRVDLGARGFYATPGVDFNRETGQGTPFFYYTQGAAVAEVEIDRFTGELRVPRADLLIDIGRSINPGVDRGQIIGGFIQGMGWVTAEALIYDAKGDLLSQRRHRSVVWPRQVGMYLAKQLTARSLPEIGRRFGNRDHTTVLHAIRKIEGELAGNPRLKEELEELKRLLSH